jgi:hypothetical protein
MSMKLVKKTSEYSIFLRGDERYAVKDADRQPVNGEEKVRILLAEGLIKVAEPSAPSEPEAAEAEAENGAEAPEDGAADDAGDAEAE